MKGNRKINFEHCRIEKIKVPSKYERTEEQLERASIYHTAQWLKVRRLKLQSHPICERCKSNGFTKAGRQIHHVISIEADSNLTFDLNNLMTLCDVCHRQVEMEEKRRQKFADVDIDVETGLPNS